MQHALCPLLLEQNWLSSSQTRLNLTVFLQVLNHVRRSAAQSVPDKNTMNSLRASADLSFLANEAFVEENTTPIMDTDQTALALKDASVILNFVYINKSKRRQTGMAYSELSGDIYNAFSKVAKDTGGMIFSTTKPAAALKKAVAAK